MSSTPFPDEPLPKRVLFNAMLGLLAFFGLIVLLAMTVREPIEALSTKIVEQLGVPGIFLMVALMDPIPGPGHQLAVLVGYTGGLPPLGIFVAASSGAVLSSMWCWWLGRNFKDSVGIQTVLTRWKIKDFLQKHGAIAIALAGVMPIPYAAATLGAGACDVPLRSLLLGSLARPVKIALALILLSLGWSTPG
jgi:membrane protein YqaA with SNARE-associated domain